MSDKFKAALEKIANHNGSRWTDDFDHQLSPQQIAREALGITCPHRNLLGSVLNEEEPFTCVDCAAEIPRPPKN